MTCAKKVVTCELRNASTGLTIYAQNDCGNPQEVCPRLPGEGYEKCISICDQKGHAEEQALKIAKGDASGYKATIYGIGWACRSCQEKLYKAGVESIKCVEGISIHIPNAPTSGSLPAPDPLLGFL